MSNTDLELAQLLCTRLCHDLAGPVGAVAAGVELIGDDPQAADAETLGLIGSSSAAASRKLKFLRAALGAAGGAPLDLKSLLDGYLEAVAGPSGRPEVHWPAANAMLGAAQAFGPLWTQAVLNLCLLGLEAQAGCRVVTLQCADRPASVRAEFQCAPGRTATVRDDLREAVAGTNAAPQTAKTIQAHFAGRIVRAAGGAIEMTAAGDRIVIVATLHGG
jgi:histidine phosphotransferase ChpT